MSLIVPLPLPARGAAARVQLGSAELVLERARGSCSLLWSDGREAKRYVLGLDGPGQLSVELRAPRHAIRVVPREVLTLVPGGRIAGYVTIPLVPTIVWRRRPEPPQTLLEIHPAALRGAWDEVDGHTLRCASSWLVRFPYQTGEPRCVMPLRLYNVGPHPISPGCLPVQIADRDLTMLRGSIVTAPRRLHWRDESAPTTSRSPTLTMEQA